MKKWYDEEYVFTIEVTGYLREITQSIYAEMGRKSCTGRWDGKK